MKSFTIFGFKIEFFFSIRRVKRLTFDLPDWADDTCISKIDNDCNTISPRIKYYKGSKVFYIDLPKCKDAILVSLTPLNGIVDGKRQQMTNRKITIDIFI